MGDLVHGQFTSGTAPVAPANTDIPLQVDSQGNLKVTGSVIPVGGGVTYTDKTITNLTGSSQTLIAANPARKSLMFKNGATVVAVNILGGSAVIGGAGCMTFQPYEGYVMEGPSCPLGTITVIGTAANYIGAFEGT